MKGECGASKSPAGASQQALDFESVHLWQSYFNSLTLKALLAKVRCTYGASRFAAEAFVSHTNYLRTRTLRQSGTDEASRLCQSPWQLTPSWLSVAISEQRCRKPSAA